MTGEMHICLRIDPGRLLRWHVWLAQELRAIEGARLHIAADSAPPWPLGMAALLALEQVLHGGAHGCNIVAPDALPAPPVAECAHGDMTISLTGKGLGGDGIVVPLFDRGAGEAAALGAVLEGRAPVLEVLADGRIQPIGLPAMEEPDVALKALDSVMARMVEGIVRMVRERLGQIPPCPAAEPVPPRPAAAVSGLRAGRFAAASLAGKIAKRIRRLAGGRQKTWMTGWRRIGPGQGVHDTFAFDEGAYAILPDDGKRFYADPFVCRRGGRHFVFVEEYPYATGKGVISVFEIGEDGQASRPRVVLEEDVHLSYPHIFSHQGQLWMIPESEAGRQVALYRCVDFPGHWEREAVLMDDVAASDATVFRHEGLWWMMASLRPPFGSSWDGLGIFMSESLHGPWRAQAGNPVLVDARAARPAGALFHHHGALYRPAQDCTGGYGAGLCLCRIGRLDAECFLQKIERNFRPRLKSGFHTLNAADGIEVVDFFG